MTTVIGTLRRVGTGFVFTPDAGPNPQRRVVNAPRVLPRPTMAITANVLAGIRAELESQPQVQEFKVQQTTRQGIPRPYALCAPQNPLNGNAPNAGNGGAVPPNPLAGLLAAARNAAANNHSPEDFFNTYGFVWQPKRDLNAAGHGDAEPHSKASFPAESYTGCLHVTLTTATPLLLIDASTRTPQDPTQHGTFDVHREGTRGLLPETSLKGMLSSAMESITASRWRVFDHASAKQPMGYRSPAQTDVVPIKLSCVNGAWTAEHFQGDTIYDAQQAAWVPFGYVGWPPAVRVTSTGISPEHGNSYYAELRLVEKWAANAKGVLIKRITYWCVVSLELASLPAPALLPLAPILANSKVAGPAPNAGHFERSDVPAILVQGVVVINNKNFSRKHDERFFFNPTPINLASDAVKRYQALIDESARTHKRELESSPPVLGPPQMPGCVWSPCVTNPSIGNEHYAYAKLIDGVVQAIYPVMISRRLYDLTAADLVDETLVPASKASEQSAADRAFGWVGPENVGATAWAGRVRIVCQPGELESVETFDPPKKLAVLGQPKPQQGRFYTLMADGTPQQGLSADNLYKDQALQKLAGRKHYLHQIDSRVWPVAGPHLQSANNPNQNQSQYRSVSSWVKPEQTFAVQLHLEDLDAFNLGALLWLLSLNTPEAAFHLKLGGGRPLGFGSVKLALTACAIESNRKARYQKPPAFAAAANAMRPNSVQIDALILEFKLALAGSEVAFNAHPAINGFRNAGIGQRNVKMPRCPNSQDIYKWFSTNAGRGGKKHALSPLHKIRGLPENPA